jgi:sulfur carrier protein
MHVQLNHPSRSIEIKGPKRAKDLLRELNLLAEAHAL